MCEESCDNDFHEVADVSPRIKPKLSSKNLFIDFDFRWAPILILPFDMAQNIVPLQTKSHANIP